MFCDMALIDGKVVTVDARETIKEAVAVKFGKILTAGSNQEIQSLIGPETKVIELKGRVLIPGLIDTHCHISDSDGLQNAMGVIDASYEGGVRSITDILVRIVDQARKKPKGSWINIDKEDESKLIEKRHPTKSELDKASPDHPVMVTTVGGHFAIVNSKAFEIAGITRETPDPPGGRFEKDPLTGELTGWIHENAAHILRPLKFGREPNVVEGMAGIKWMAEKYAASGLTCAYDGFVKNSSIVRAYQELLARNELPLRIRLDMSFEVMPQLGLLGIIQGFGNDMLKISGIKIAADGAISARTAAVADSYLHRPGYFGELAIAQERLHQIIMQGYEKGYRFCVHANGERAINMFLDVIQEAQEKFPREDPRNRIIHCTVVTPEIIARVKKLDLLPTIFGPYPYYHGDKILPAFGAERLERMFAARSFLDTGIKVAAHSDNAAAPYPPLMGIHALVNRISANGRPIGLSQRISVLDALKLYTINAAYHTFEEGVTGSIECGKFADMVVLGEDLFTVPPKSIINIPVIMTIVGGKIVHQRES